MTEADNGLLPLRRKLGKTKSSSFAYGVRSRVRLFIADSAAGQPKIMAYWATMSDAGEVLCQEGIMQTACLRHMGKKLLVALTMKGKFAGNRELHSKPANLMEAAIHPNRF